ncbi:zf-HC2 domain-containing protein [Jeotgalibaca caeni]|uniref:zf-HC2 domain-containing protein n=1 Tax=Jeotgalibaca caeni TaxID=3028623 RepID=UPI00237DE265|nr:zf-HC2 domain-containing protein [Jeotgalibaca caeni]MDE1549945.1 zf-HC2 domain-containing protein [Jeotgalibaca caeni]
MKISCAVIQDLLPLYVEDMVSSESRELVEKHIETCENCRRELEGLNEEVLLPIENNPSPLVKVRSSLKKKRRQVAILSMLLTFVIGIVVVSYITAPDYYPYDLERVTITKSENGNVLATFDEHVTGYRVDQSDEGQVYHVTTWSTLWGKWSGERLDNPVVLNPNGEEVAAVYYSAPDGSSNTYLYGEEVYADGGIMILPRLYFAYYTGFSILLWISSIGIALFKRGNKNVRVVATRISFLPLSYLIGHLLIKGTSMSSYSATRELSAILLVMIPLFLLLLSMYQIMLHKENNH